MNRILWADSLKGILMLLVILGHVIQTIVGGVDTGNHLWSIIYSFHMPAFMAVSGYFALKLATQPINKFQEFSINVLRRTQQLLIPYLIWSFINLVINIDFKISSILNIFIYPDTSFWFLWVLFLINVIFQIGELISNVTRINNLIIHLLICAILIGIMVLFEIRILGFQFLAYYYIFYLFGYCFRKFKTFTINSKAALIILTILWFYLAWNWKMSNIPDNMTWITFLPSNIIIYAYRLFTALIAVTVILSISPEIFNSTNLINNFTGNFGRISLGIYTTHLILVNYVINFLQVIWTNVPSSLLAILSFTILTILSYLIVKFINLNKFTARIFLGKI